MNGYYWEGIENNFIEFKIIFVDSRFIFFYFLFEFPEQWLKLHSEGNALLGNYYGQADRQTDRPGHSEVSLPISSA